MESQMKKNMKNEMETTIVYHTENDVETGAGVRN